MFDEETAEDERDDDDDEKENDGWKMRGLRDFRQVGTTGVWQIGVLGAVTKVLLLRSEADDEQEVRESDLVGERRVSSSGVILRLVQAPCQARQSTSWPASWSDSHRITGVSVVGEAMVPTVNDNSARSRSCSFCFAATGGTMALETNKADKEDVLLFIRKDGRLICVSMFHRCWERASIWLRGDEGEEEAALKGDRKSLFWPTSRWLVTRSAGDEADAG